MKLRGFNNVGSFVGIIAELGSKLSKAFKVSVEMPAPDFISTRLGCNSTAYSGQHRTYQHDRASKCGIFLAVIVGIQIVVIDGIGLERPAAWC